VSPEILAIGGGRELANPAELPIEVGKVGQADLVRNDVYRQAGLAQAHARTTDAKFTQITTHTFACVFHKETMKRSWRNVPNPAQRVDAKRF
jgi:hypothetical protein